MRLRGRIVHGDGRGAGMGWPTANLLIDSTLTVSNGVYAAWVEVNGKRFGAMANLGIKPTFSENGARVLELHLFGFEGDLYGREIEAELCEFVRSERKFASVEELVAQIGEDEILIKKILCI